jgi:T5SS/PEP-CTERM-associated repeat protein
MLDITNGGTVNDTNGTLGNQTGSSGTAIVDGNGSQWNNNGTLNVGPTGTGIVDIADGGAVTAGGGTTVGPNGTIMGDGTITTPALINNGTVMPIGPNGGPGTLTENGNYQQGSTGMLDIGIGGKQPPQSDKLAIDGNAKLDGNLDLSSLNNFHPSSGDTFQVISTTGTTTGYDFHFGQLTIGPTATLQYSNEHKTRGRRETHAKTQRRQGRREKGHTAVTHPTILASHRSSLAKRGTR